MKKPIFIVLLLMATCLLYAEGTGINPLIFKPKGFESKIPYSYIIETKEKTYHVIDIWSQYVTLQEYGKALEIREKPGEESRIIEIINTSDHVGLYNIIFEAVAITYEESWVKIEYKGNKYGWVEEHDLSAERIGPTILLPDYYPDPYGEFNINYPAKSKVNLKENGTILSKVMIGNHQYEVRKCEISNFVYDAFDSPDIPVYDDYINKNIIGSIKGDEIDGEDEYGNPYFLFNTKEILLDDNYPILIKISHKNITGWINFGGYNEKIYENGEYEYLESIKSGTKIWTIRKYNDEFYLRFDPDTKVEVKDKPGSDGNVIDILEYALHKAPYEGHYVEKYYTIEIAEDENDYYSDFWVKIFYNSTGKVGWITSKGIFRTEEKWYSPVRHINLNTPEYKLFFLANQGLFSDY